MNSLKYFIKVAVTVISCGLCIDPAFSTELTFEPVLPQFNGSNGQSLIVLQYEERLRTERKADIEAEIRAIEREAELEANRVTPATRLVDALTNQLQFRLASGFTDEILNGATANSLNIGGILLDYTRIDGLLTVTITEPGKEPVTIQLPVSN